MTKRKVLRIIAEIIGGIGTGVLITKGFNMVYKAWLAKKIEKLN